MEFATQETVDAAFADLHSLLAANDVSPDVHLRCVHCQSYNLQRSANPGANVQFYNCCHDCGAVQPHAFGFTDDHFFHGRHVQSNYKRIHHWHERISQLLLCESAIPNDVMLQIAERLCDGSYTVINKDAVRCVLRSLNKQLYIEKWLQIIQRITGIEPPKPGSQLLCRLDDLFIELQTPFKNYKQEGRKNFLNYNYCFARLFQKLGCPQFAMFFPLIKSKAKLKALDDTWQQMTKGLGQGWEFTELQHVPPFAVKIQSPDVLLSQLRERVASAALVATPPAQNGTGYRKSDQRLLRELGRQMQLRQRRSSPPEPLSQRPASSKRKRSPASAEALRPLRRSRVLPRPV